MLLGFPLRDEDDRAVGIGAGGHIGDATIGGADGEIDCEFCEIDTLDKAFVSNADENFAGAASDDDVVAGKGKVLDDFGFFDVEDGELVELLEVEGEVLAAFGGDDAGDGRWGFDVGDVG